MSVAEVTFGIIKAFFTMWPPIIKQQLSDNWLMFLIILIIYSFMALDTYKNNRRVFNNSVIKIIGAIIFVITLAVGYFIFGIGIFDNTWLDLLAALSIPIAKYIFEYLHSKIMDIKRNVRRATS